ncbi:MAG: bifunctional pyr operon transcriptional regulator/uracil phosphoribosyltransferase PyrR [Thermodesulfobacteriota bacterium]
MQAGDTTVLLNADEIRKALERIAREIVDRGEGTVKDLALIGIHTRGVFLARRIGAVIAGMTGENVRTGTVDITLYRDDWTRISYQPVVQSTDIAFSVDDRRVVLVDDVLFTGRTTRAALDALTDFGRPSRVELAVLVDRGLRELPIRADYVGKSIETSRVQTVNVMLAECDESDLVVVRG